MQPDAPLKTFICYAHEDHEVVDGLKKQLAIFEKKGLLRIWSDGKILPGEHWDKSIKVQLEQAELILLFVSVDFINSDYIETTELKAALQRHHDGHATLVPIIVRHCHWTEYFEIGQFQALPLKARPILSNHFPHRDEAFFEIAEGVKKTAENIRNLRIAAALEAEAQSNEEAANQERLDRLQRKMESFRLKDEAAWESAIEEDTLHAYETYLHEGFTKYKTEAENLIRSRQNIELKRKMKEAKEKEDIEVNPNFKHQLFQHVFSLPSLGEDISGKIIEILLKAGEWVKKDQIALIVGTDKVDAEIPVDVDGFVESILVQKGDTVTEGSAILLLNTLKTH